MLPVTQNVIFVRQFGWFSNILIFTGLLSASFVVPLFLPKSESESEAICQNLVGGGGNKSEQSFTTPASSSALSQEEQEEEKFNALTLPFIIVASWICIAGLGFIFLVISGLQLPNVKENEAQCLKITKNVSLNNVYFWCENSNIFTSFCLTFRWDFLGDFQTLLKGGKKWRNYNHQC